MADAVRLQTLADRMHFHHRRDGSGIWMRTWSCIHACTFVLTTEWNHMYLEKRDYMLMCPRGTFMCGRCHEECAMNEETPAEWYVPDEYLCCSPCAEAMIAAGEATLSHFDSLFTTLWHVSSPQELEGWPEYVAYEDVRGVEEPLRAEVVKQGRAVAESLGFTYADGKSIQELVEERLARRVVRRFRRHRVRNMRKRLRWVLYAKGHMGRWGAEAMAERCIPE